MTVYRLDVAYDGSGFRGYAKQDGHRTVQGELDLAIGTVLGAPIGTAVAGRTDAGVHALGQVVSFEYEGDVDERRLLRSLNGMVGSEIAIMRIAAERDDFNARFSATWRRYRYLIDQRATPDPLTRHTVWHVGKPLDLKAMETVAAAYLGQHDFTSFCKAVEGKSNVRRVSESVLIQGDDFLEYWIQANAFCHQMVRSLVGFMYDVGRGYSDGGTAETVIASKDRANVASVAPPHGLTLWEVGY
jgi:tRNA pseudouridine38-40 synthase